MKGGRHLKRWKWLVWAVLLVAALAACGEKPQDEPAPEEETPPEQQQEQPPEDDPNNEDILLHTLTQEELEEFTSLFNSAERNGLLRFPYQDPSEAALYLDLLFYDDSGSAADMTAEELAAVEAAGVFTELDMRKLTTDHILEYLQENFGLERAEAETVLAQAGDRAGVYLLEYDAYYSCRGDTEMQQYLFTDGCRFRDGSVQLYYTAGALYCNRESDPEGSILLDVPMHVQLRPNGSGGWYASRNMMDGSC